MSVLMNMPGFRRSDEPCNPTEERPPEYSGKELWCSIHSAPAAHISTDRSRYICYITAYHEDCGCCPYLHRG